MMFQVMIISEFEADLEYMRTCLKNIVGLGRRKKKKKRRKKKGNLKRRHKMFPCPRCLTQSSASAKEASGKARSKVELAGSLLTA